MLRQLLSLFFLCFVSGQQLMADGVYRDGVGAVSSGRGGTNIAHHDNGAVLLDNPAALVNLHRDRLFELGLDTVITDLDYSDADPNRANGKFRPVSGPTLAYIEKQGDWAFGFGAFVPAGFTAEFDLNHPVFGETKYRSLGGISKVLPALSFQVTDQLSVGATFGVSYSLVELEGPLTGQSGLLTGVPGLFDFSADGYSTTWSVGLQYQLSEQTTIGLTFNSENRFRLQGEADLSLPGPGPALIDATYDLEMDIVWPRTLGVGLAHLIGERSRFSADVIWFDWSHAFDRFDLTLSNGSNPILNTLTGPTVRDSLPANWRDSISVRLGWEQFLTHNDLFRCGYVYHRRTAPLSTLNPYLDGILQHTLSAGYERRMTSWDGWRWNVAYQFTWGQEQNVGTSTLVGGDFSNSELKAQAHWLMFSLIYEQ